MSRTGSAADLPSHLNTGLDAIPTVITVTDVPGLVICTEFINIAEVCALRQYFEAFEMVRAFVMYYFNGYTMQRRDMGPEGMQAEGDAALGDRLNQVMQMPLEIQDLISTLNPRTVAAFGDGASSPLAQQAVQMTQIRPHSPLSLHFDHRSKWGPIILSVVWGAVEAADPRGEQWVLRLSKNGAGAAPDLEHEFVLPPGCAYIISGKARGYHTDCDARTDNHGNCTCCYRHGVRCVDGAGSDRQSITLRRFDM